MSRSWQRYVDALAFDGVLLVLLFYALATQCLYEQRSFLVPNPFFLHAGHLLCVMAGRCSLAAPALASPARLLLVMALSTFAADSLAVVWRLTLASRELADVRFGIETLHLLLSLALTASAARVGWCADEQARSLTPDYASMSALERGLDTTKRGLDTAKRSDDGTPNSRTDSPRPRTPPDGDSRKSH